MGAENSKLRASSLKILRTLSGGKFRRGSSKYGTSSSNSLENLAAGGSKSSKSAYFRQGSSANKPKSESVRYKTKWPIPHVEKDFLPVYNMRTENQKDYTINGVIACGAYGNVLKGFENKTKRFVAIKVIDKSRVLSEGPGAIQQCKDEVLIQSDLPKSPYIVELVAFWQTRNRLYLVQEFIENGELFDLWKSIRMFSDSLARFYLTQITSALDFLHRNNVVYRDLKMENILLDTRARIKLIDFGLSKQLRENERTFTTCGTLQYTAPEVLRGDAYGHEADWWSLGILGYALLAGKFPVFGARDHVEMRNMVASHQYRMPLHFTNEVSDFFTLLLQKNPENRKQSSKGIFDHRYFHGLLAKADNLSLEYFVTDNDVNKLPDSFRLRQLFFDSFELFKMNQEKEKSHGIHDNNNITGHDNNSFITTSSTYGDDDDEGEVDNISSDYAEPIWNMNSGAPGNQIIPVTVVNKPIPVTMVPNNKPVITNFPVTVTTDNSTAVSKQPNKQPPQLRPVNKNVIQTTGGNGPYQPPPYHRWSTFDLPPSGPPKQMAYATTYENGIRDLTTPTPYQNFPKNKPLQPLTNRNSGPQSLSSSSLTQQQQPQQLQQQQPFQYHVPTKQNPRSQPAYYQQPYYNNHPPVLLQPRSKNI